MADIIQLLPEAIANQIAAGEVVQRPASVVKELMENAIDAGATSIKLIIKDAGKTLIQVIDNGSGMSETDARMCFERHATSKIREAKDLFSIRTMGFRGEAMASIAAVAQIEMRTRPHNEELGVRIVIEGSKLTIHEPCQCTAGSNISVKNLFYNVPARRNFLKTDPIEMRHIFDEFQRIVLANTDVFFSLHNNGQEVFHLPPANLRQRIVGIFGNNFNPKLVPVSEATDVMKITGFIGKPEFARKTRGEQMFFVNQRFIKSGYLHHAVMSAYEDLLPKDTYPFYVLFIEIAPDRIDINVHPTKQEIKFDDERLVYNYLRVVVRHALGQYNITPSLDFDQESNLAKGQYSGLPLSTSSQQDFEREMSQAHTTEFSGRNSTVSGFDRDSSSRERSNLKNWQKLFTDDEEDFEKGNAKRGESEEEGAITIESEWPSGDESGSAPSLFTRQAKEPCQIHASYIVSQLKSGFMLIDQQAAHERILYERYLQSLENKQAWTQQELFPKTLNLSAADTNILRDILSDVNLLGFNIQEFGKDTFIIHGIPVGLRKGQNEVAIIESLIEQFKLNIELNLGIRENLAHSMARSTSLKHNQTLTVIEMQELIDQLFACSIPFKSPSGRNCFLIFNLNELEERFKNQ